MATILVNHVTPKPTSVTGINVYSACILEALAKHGRHDYVLVTNWAQEKIPPALTRNGVQVVSRRTFANESLALAHSSVLLPYLARRFSAALVFHPQPNAALFAGRRDVVVIHDLYRVTHAGLYSRAQRLQWDLALAPAFQRAGNLIAVSAATREALQACYPGIQARVTVVHEASPITPPAEPPPPPDGSREPYALMVANLTPNKNFGLLIAALRRLAARGQRPRVCWAGRDDAGILPSLLSDAGDVRLERLGPVDDATLLRLYAHAHVYINTSKVEGFCLPILEAHSFGRPVICSDVPVLREVAGDAAVFVNPDDAEGLAQALESLFADPVRHEELSRRARANAARFSWEKAARETEAVFDRAMSTAPSHG